MKEIKIKQEFAIKTLHEKNQIFTFWEHHNIPPDNNKSERAIRNVKVKIKVLGILVL